MGASGLRVRAGVVNAVSRDRGRGVAYLRECLSQDKVASPHPAALNGAWPAAFFGIRDKRASLVIVAALDLSLGFEVVRLRLEDRRAAGLLVPYLAWCGFATALNTAVSEPDASHSQ
jgi:TspO/MBR family